MNLSVVSQLIQVQGYYAWKKSNDPARFKGAEDFVGPVFMSSDGKAYVFDVHKQEGFPLKDYENIFICSDRK